MSVVIPIAPARVEVELVTQNGSIKWLMAVLYGADVVDAVFFPTRAAAVASAKEWSLPIRFVQPSGSFEA